MRKLLIVFLTLLHSIYSIEVGNDGSLNHTIGIEIPQALIAPRLSIGYNSNSANSCLGLGFQLQGILAITRINHGEGIQYNGADTYAGSSGRLIEVAPNEYNYQNQNFSKIEAYGICGDAPCQFIEYTNGGGKIYYGSANPGLNDCISENACISAQGRGHSPRVCMGSL